MDSINKNLPKYSDIPNPQDLKSRNDYKLSDATVEKMYATVYHGLTTKFDLSMSDSVLMATIISLSKEKYGGYCYMSQENLASLLKSTAPTINEKLQRLEERGLIERAPERSRYGTIQWRGTEEVRAYVEYLQMRCK